MREDEANRFDEKVLARFWSKVDKSGECWIWTAGRFRAGYGGLRYQGETLYAHRVSFEIAHGPIPEGAEVLHSCDNPPCVNPAHLRIGTHAENMGDMALRRRHRFCDRHHWARLTETGVREILAARGVSSYRLAAIYGVSYQTIARIRAGSSWRLLAVLPA